jgi:signal-transduction protein with cAMP-binding, CBS, and nucleotidyltransferase domain
MSLKNFLEKTVTITCPENISARAVAQMMKEHNVGTIVVVTNDQKPLGLITDRDLVLRCISESEDCSKMTAAQVMSSPFLTVSDHSSILDLVEEMSTHHVRRMGVTNTYGDIVAILSMADVFELLAHEINQLSLALGSRDERLFSRSNGKAYKSDIWIET